MLDRLEKEGEKPERQEGKLLYFPRTPFLQMGIKKPMVFGKGLGGLPQFDLSVTFTSSYYRIT